MPAKTQATRPLPSPRCSSSADLSALIAAGLIDHLLVGRGERGGDGGSSSNSPPSNRPDSAAVAASSEAPTRRKKPTRGSKT